MLDLSPQSENSKASFLKFYTREHYVLSSRVLELEMIINFLPFYENIIPISYKDSLTVPKNVDHIPDWSYLMLNCKQTADCKQIADAAIAKNRTNLVLN